MKTGYLHPEYAASLQEFGSPHALPHCEGWLLKRQIPGCADSDAMSCYPLFACRNWSQLHADLQAIGPELVCLSVVTDPFGDYDLAYLQRCFKDQARPFKEHFIIELGPALDTFVSSHHRRYAHKALRALEIAQCIEPVQFLDEWVTLYATLIKRHNIKGLVAFSRSAFASQFSVPGLVVFRAVYEDKTVGMVLWYIQDEVGYYHLGAYSDAGYNLRASFALFWVAIEYFTALGLRGLNLGAGAGVTSDGLDGLSRFKRGWSTGTRTAYFCGHIFNRTRYSELVKIKGVSAVDYFPAYRKGEFG